METMMLLTDEVRAFLAEPRFAVLATANADGSPQQTVMWYELQGDEIMMNTARGRLKDNNLRRDPRISICVDDGYRFVTIAGTARLIEDQETAQADIFGLAVRYHGREQGEKQAQTFRAQTRITIRLSIDRAYVRGFDGDD
ncbi:MAG TPA: PPOX class F420-dependent oxidoreductase [Ktedonobacterales bacterium]